MSSRLIYAGIGFILCVLTAFVGPYETYAGSKAQYLDISASALSIKSANGNHLASFTVEIAKTPSERRRGLMFRPPLNQISGMLFIFPDLAKRSFWMRNTPQSLDILFADNQGKIVTVHAHTIPNSDYLYESDVPAQFALELMAGQVEANGISVGNALLHPVIMTD